MSIAGMFDLHGQVALVTGAASGLGLAYAEILAEAGAQVVMTDLDMPGLRAAATRIGATAAVMPDTAELDVGDAERLATVIDGAAAKHGRLDIVFANAGISAGRGFALSPDGELGNLDHANWDKVLRVNLTGTVNTMQFAARHMKAGGGGRIVVTASIGGIRAEPMVGYAYAATKAAVLNLVRQAAVELAPHKVLVNAIAPGPFLTNIAGGRLHREPDVVAMFAEMVPLGRIGLPEEIKGLALLLASPAGSFLTGTVIPVDGGATAAV
ncbi:SDR family NAD(P)-dependent oxidoreductase [Roseomonas sp. BN140053]|uniref:SDR family NAD(P)-dependent oxidoreductase n=1 Tax=Roseomonas sp. BN140053 TaxID=3391898 RepID=UPI0039EA6AB2